MTTNTEALPEPAFQGGGYEDDPIIDYYTAEQMHAHAAKLFAARDAEIERLNEEAWNGNDVKVAMAIKHTTDVNLLKESIKQRDAEIERLRSLLRNVVLTCDWHGNDGLDAMMTAST